MAQCLQCFWTQLHVSPSPSHWAGLRLKRDCTRILPSPGAGHFRALQKPPGPCRSLQLGQAGGKDAAELGRAQEPARVQISGSLGCSNPAPRACSGSNGAQFGVWTPHLGDTTLGHLVSFMQTVNLCRFSGSMKGCALLMACCSRSEEAVLEGGWSLEWDTASHSLRGMSANMGSTDTTLPCNSASPSGWLQAPVHG